MKIYVDRGDSPLVLAQPHGGSEIPSEIFHRLNNTGRAREDTDWHISRLYHGLIENTTVVSTPIHRYVVDANRDPFDESLYPGQNTTSLCPTTNFDGSAIYRDGEEPDKTEIRERQLKYHQPYHDALAEQLERVHQKHGYVLLYDCHSIRSLIPYLFDGRLADFNIGTNNGTSCDPDIEARVVDSCAKATHYTHVLNGRFKGGWTTRHYGNPDRGYHAIQMELAQYNYMDEKPPWKYGVDKAERLRKTLCQVLSDVLAVVI